MTAPIKFRNRIAQGEPPAPAPEPGGGMPDMGGAEGGMGGEGGGMPPMAGGGGGMMDSSEPGSSQMNFFTGSNRQEIIGPITSIAQLFYDVDIPKYIENHPDQSPDQIATKIWVAYGGEKTGGVNPSKQGKRVDINPDVQPDPKQLQLERQATKNKKWERLKVGEHISDVTDLSSLSKSITGILTTLITQTGSPPAGGGPPALGASKARIVIAYHLDNEQLYKQSDYLINQVIHRISQKHSNLR